ncbi:MAG: ECF RNA polymerase sigma factor SigK [Sporichthyaceae bacterium]
MTHPVGPTPEDSTPDGAEVSLEDLLRQVALGDTQAFEVVYTRISAPVYGITRRVLRDVAQAEEVTQETMLWVWREATRFDEARGSAMAWIMTVARRRAVDRVRSSQSAADRERRAGLLEVARAYDEVSENVLHRLDREAVRLALDALTPMQRESVTLAYYDGYTYREVSEILQVPLGTTKTRIRDGLLRMRDALDASV